jgi:GxxExxY protein
VHPLYEKADSLSQLVIGAAIEVQRHKGPGLIESIYERCLLRELELRSVPATTQKIVRVEYKGLVFDEPLRFDVLVDDCLLAELKAVETVHSSSKAQLFRYMNDLRFLRCLLFKNVRLFTISCLRSALCREQIKQKATKRTKLVQISSLFSLLSSVQNLGLTIAHGSGRLSAFGGTSGSATKVVRKNHK